MRSSKQKKTTGANPLRLGVPLGHVGLVDASNVDHHLLSVQSALCHREIVRVENGRFARVRVLLAVLCAFVAGAAIFSALLLPQLLLRQLLALAAVHLDIAVVADVSIVRDLGLVVPERVNVEALFFLDAQFPELLDAGLDSCCAFQVRRTMSCQSARREAECAAFGALVCRLRRCRAALDLQHRATLLFHRFLEVKGEQLLFTLAESCWFGKAGFALAGALGLLRPGLLVGRLFHLTRCYTTRHQDRQGERPTAQLDSPASAFRLRDPSISFSTAAVAWSTGSMPLAARSIKACNSDMAAIFGIFVDFGSDFDTRRKHGKRPESNNAAACCVSIASCNSPRMSIFGHFSNSFGAASHFVQEYPLGTLPSIFLLSCVKSRGRFLLTNILTAETLYTVANQ